MAVDDDDDEEEDECEGNGDGDDERFHCRHTYVSQRYC